jgi:hypothetical protein
MPTNLPRHAMTSKQYNPDSSCRHTAFPSTRIPPHPGKNDRGDLHASLLCLRATMRYSTSEDDQQRSLLKLFRCLTDIGDEVVGGE